MKTCQKTYFSQARLIPIYVWVRSSGWPSLNSQIRTSSNIALPNVPLQPKALSAPVTTCALAKPCATCLCSNTFVIDTWQAQLSAPMVAVDASGNDDTLSPRRLELGSPTNFTSWVLQPENPHLNCLTTSILISHLYSGLLESIKIIFPDFCCSLISRSQIRTHLFIQFLTLLNMRGKAESLKYSLWPRSATLCFYLFRV